jgi:hypothetical protein
MLSRIPVKIGTAVPSGTFAPKDWLFCSPGETGICVRVKRPKLNENVAVSVGEKTSVSFRVAV